MLEDRDGRSSQGSAGQEGWKITTRLEVLNEGVGRSSEVRKCWKIGLEEHHKEGSVERGGWKIFTRKEVLNEALEDVLKEGSVGRDGLKITTRKKVFNELVGRSSQGSKCWQIGLDDHHKEESVAREDKEVLDEGC